MKKIVLALFLTIAISCSQTTVTHGVPNLVQVRSNVWRSGQPTTEGWHYLHQLFGNRTVHVVKLNFDSEESDNEARMVGFDVHVLSIDPRTNPDGLTTTVSEIFKEPTARMCGPRS